MNRITISILLALLLSLAVRGVTGAVEIASTTDKLIRLHVVANSDSEEDQELKLEVRDAVLGYVSELTGDCESKEEAVSEITSHIEEIAEAAESVLIGTGLEVSVSYENVLVDKREYDDFTLPEGYYDALCVLIGEASGKNWWCVLYPSLCVSGAMSIDACEELDDSDLIIIKEPQKVKYKLFCYELWQKVKELFNDSKSLIGT